MGETQVASAQPFVLAFDSTHAAMAAQAAFKAAGASFSLIPTPREISAGCGMSLKFKAEGAAVGIVLFEIEDILNLRSTEGIY